MRQLIATPRRVVGAVLLLLTLAPFPTRAQWVGELSFETMLDDNAFRNSGSSSAMMTGTNLSYGYVGGADTWSFNYSGFLATFTPWTDRQYSIHTLGATWLLPYGADDENGVTLSASGTSRFDQSAYEYYDYSQAAIKAAWQHQISESWISRLSGRTRYRSYANFMDLRHLENVLSLGSSLAFETRTSVIADITLGFKHYLTTPAIPQAATAGVTGTSSPLSVDGSGNGSGGGGNGNGSGGGNGYGNGMRGVGTGLGNHGGIGDGVQYIVFDEPTTSQMTASLNIAQSLGENTGISLRLLQRWNLQDRGRALAGAAVDFIGEDELFDDAYSYESREISMVVTQLLPWSMKFQSTAFLHAKDYAYAASMAGGSGDVLRSDLRFGGILTLEKSFDTSILLFDGVTVAASYSFTRNQSNAVYYDYGSNAFSLGFETSF